MMNFIRIKSVFTFPMAALPDGALKKPRTVNLKESITYLFLSKEDIMLCSLFSYYYHVFKLKVI